MTKAEAADALPITVLQFGFHRLDVEFTASVAQAIINKFDVLASETVKWEMSDCDGSPSIRFDLSQSPWLLESDAFKPVIDAMYKECLQMIQAMAANDDIGAKFRCVSVEFAEDPYTVDALKQIFDLHVP